MQMRPFRVALVLSMLAVPGGWAQSGPPAVVLSQPIHSTGAAVEANLQSADATTLAQTLGSALGGTVRIDGTVPGPVTLDLTGAPPRAALDAVARALYGTWRPIYSVTAGAAPTGGPHPAALGRTVTANLTDVSARAAFALVARAGGGSLELPSSIDKNVTLVVNDAPVEAALDDLAKQTGATWAITYVLMPGVGPPTAAHPQTQARPTAPPARPPLPSPTQPAAPP